MLTRTRGVAARLVRRSAQAASRHKCSVSKHAVTATDAAARTLGSSGASSSGIIRGSSLSSRTTLGGVESSCRINASEHMRGVLTGNSRATSSTCAFWNNSVGEKNSVAQNPPPTSSTSTYNSSSFYNPLAPGEPIRLSDQQPEQGPKVLPQSVLEDLIKQEQQTSPLDFERLKAWLQAKVPKGFGAFYPKKSEGGKAKDEEKGGEKGDKDPEPPMEPKYVAAAVQLAILAVLVYALKGDQTPEITFQELVNDFLRFGYIERLQVVNKESCRVILRDDVTLPNNLVKRLGESKEFVVHLGSPESFESRIESYQHSLGIHPQDFIPIQYVQERDYREDLRALASPLVALSVLFLILKFTRFDAKGGGKFPSSFGGGGRNMFNMGKVMETETKSTTKFSDVAGLSQAKVEVTEFVDFLKNPKKYEHLGAKIPKGGLLVGPPGTGKTLLAKAIAGEAERPFFAMSGSDFIEMFVGVGPSRVRDLFAQAREKAPSIVWIDEIDAVGRKRNKGGWGGGGNDERESTLNQLLVEMDGFNNKTGVIVLAGTNRADILDNALTRAGRFDRHISIDIPDIKEREEIFMVHLKPLKFAEALSHQAVARRMAALTPGFSGADIANICNEAAILAARRNSTHVEQDDFERATERTLGGHAKTNTLMSQEQKTVIAKHESGHAVTGWFLKHADPLLKVSIVPRSNGALGFAQYLPDDTQLHSKESLLDRMAMTLGGRAAEELFIGSITTGASDDLKKVTSMAYRMVTQMGMSEKIGLFNYHQDQDSQFTKPYSEETAQVIDEEVKAMIDGQYDRVKKLLKEKEHLIEALSAKLFEKETLVYQDLLEVLGPRPGGLKKGYEDFITASSSKPDNSAGGKGEKAKEDSSKGGDGPVDTSGTGTAKPEEILKDVPSLASTGASS
ncbi:unnamed protein product [Amoebophrya sp. A25]|nr:unnamed protein product [Amoebophrya sp. A25]|eukprot:GSA25T00010341001.1